MIIKENNDQVFVMFLDWMSKEVKKLNKYGQPIYISEHNLRLQIKLAIGSVYFAPSDRWLDVGCGLRPYEMYFPANSYVGVDIEASGRAPHLKAPDHYYDGRLLPFPDDSFDVALLITVLHHTKKPIEILKEAIRVAPRIIVMEDLYKNLLQKYLTFAMDSLLNLEFFGHPHTNMTQEQWESVR